MLESLRWVVCGGLGGFAALLLVCNWGILIGTLQTRRPSSLVFPFVCGPVCATACWFSPSAFLQQWFWIPLVLDFPLWMLVSLGISVLVRWVNQSPPAVRSPDDASPSE